MIELGILGSSKPTIYCFELGSQCDSGGISNSKTNLVLRSACSTRRRKAAAKVSNSICNWGSRSTSALASSSSALPYIAPPGSLAAFTTSVSFYTFAQRRRRQRVPSLKVGWYLCVWGQSRRPSRLSGPIQMSALGQKQICAVDQPMSALCQADIAYEKRMPALLRVSAPKP
jgi:hypothetical protein